MAKVILINGNQETLVANVKSTVEAFQFASLLQAILHPESSAFYTVEHKHNKTLKRTIPDSFKNTVNCLHYLREHLKPIF